MFFILSRSFFNPIVDTKRFSYYSCTLVIHHVRTTADKDLHICTILCYSCSFVDWQSLALSCFTFFLSVSTVFTYLYISVKKDIVLYSFFTCFFTRSVFSQGSHFSFCLCWACHCSIWNPAFFTVHVHHCLLSNAIQVELSAWAKSLNFFPRSGLGNYHYGGRWGMSRGI